MQIVLLGKSRIFTTALIHNTIYVQILHIIWSLLISSYVASLILLRDVRKSFFRNLKIPMRLEHKYIISS